MIRYSVEKKVRYPRDLVFRALRDNQVLLNEKLPNVKDSEIVNRISDGSGVTMLCSHVKGRAHIPFMLRNVVKPELIEWYAHQKWNAGDYSCEYNIEAIHFRDNVDIRGRWTFSEDDKGNTLIRIRNRICIDANGVKGVPSGLMRPVSMLAEGILYSLTGPSLNRLIEELNVLLDGVAKAPVAAEA